MVCIYCADNTKVTNSRPLKADNLVWRRRQCLKCSAIFTTKELIDLEQAVRVSKKSGVLEPFYRDKLFMSIYKSVDNLEAPVKLATALTNTVLRRIIKQSSYAVISSEQINLLCAQVIKRYDAAAGVRYLSYKAPTKLANDVRRLLK
jgi:transcriptional repressor NrdR